MKKIFLMLFLASGLIAQAQVYNNEWIDYNKTYYKFQVAVTGLYRISQPALAAIGLDSTPVQNFQLFRNGKEVPLYTSVSSGMMGSSDYIEFWGQMNDGKPDNSLYNQTDFQLSNMWSLETDTAAYFLTVNSLGTGLRLASTPNNIAGNILPPEPYFVDTVGSYFKGKINPGYAAIVGDYLYSSVYDQGEGWSSGDFYPGTLYTLETENNLNVYTGTGAPAPHLRINASGNALNTRSFRVRVNGDSVLGQEMDFFNYVKVDIPISMADITGASVTVDLWNWSPVSTDRMVVAQDEIVYPRQFNFGGAKNFFFSLPANINGNYLEISNFNYGGTAPVLYDLTNGNRYVADITNPALIKIALLPSSVDRNLVLVSEDPSNVKTVNTFKQRIFNNPGLAANQGNYLIISNQALLTASNGSHPVDDYSAYRSSAAGGGYNVKVYMIDELVDEFAFGIKMDPLSIRNFIRWARNNFTSPVKDVLLIGKGVTYDQVRANESDPNINKLFFVPTFGNPGSDMLLSAEPGTSLPLTPIGRISVITGDELNNYLSKVKEYEQAQAFSSSLIADKAWMKNVVHVIGGNDPVLGAILTAYMSNYQTIISDTLFGANVVTFSKTSTGTVQQLTNTDMQAYFQQGIGLLTYFGHSSASTLDFNLDNPQQYNNPGKYPVMIVMGCNAGNFFDYNLQRLSNPETLTETFVLAQERGSIAFIASTALSIAQYLDIYNTATYNAAANTLYGKTLGELLLHSINQTYSITTPNDYYARINCEQTTLDGDPALKLNTFAKPDYAVEDPLVKISPQFISLAQTQFRVDAKFINLGKAINTKVIIEVKRTYPDLTTAVILRDTLPNILYSDSITFYVPIVATRDKGDNKITITIDPDNLIDELYKNNNSITKDVYIYQDEASPVYPYNYAIVNNANIKLVASTADPFAPTKQYMMELDTTELFSSPFMITKTISSSGGILEFTPGITFTDSTVYYWRVAPVPASGQPIWNTASFIYLPASQFGFNQSHYFQHLNSSMDRVYLDTISRQWRFDSLSHNLFVNNTVFPTGGSQESNFTVSVDGNPYIRSAMCWVFIDI